MKKRFLCKLIAAAVSVLVTVSSMSAYRVVTFGAESAVDDSWKAKLDNPLLEKMDECDGKIPVWLWMALKEPTGEEFNKMVKEKIEAGNSNVSDETELEILAAENPELSKEKLENLLLSKKIDTYLSAYRSVKDEICDKSNQLVFSQLGIPEENIIKSKTAAPLYIVYIEKDDIQRVAENPLVMAMYYYDMDAVAVPDVVEIPNDFDPAAPSDDVSGTYNEKTEELLGKDQYGDTNRNGIYETSDALEILKMTVQLRETDSYADANLDGKVTAEDALEVLKRVVKIK